MTTFIIGSREDPIYPNVVPKDIIFINGAIYPINILILKVLTEV